MLLIVYVPSGRNECSLGISNFIGQPSLATGRAELGQHRLRITQDRQRSLSHRLSTFSAAKLKQNLLSTSTPQFSVNCCRPVPKVLEISTNKVNARSTNIL